jgi:NDP-sugar pyrophosphorylase family protein
MIDAAIILAGGKGSRLAPWWAPKCLLPVNGVPIIEHIFSIVNHHVARHIVCVGYRGKDVRAALRDRHWSFKGGSGYTLFSDAGEDAPMCGRLLKARAEHNVKGRALVCYGDELVDVDVASLERHHEQHAAQLSFVAHSYKLPVGVINLDAEADRDVIDDEAHELINVGFVIADPKAWAHIQPEFGLSQWINAASKAFGSCRYRHIGRRATINSLPDLEYAESVWR